MFTTYDVELTLKRDMLATNPCDPNVHDTHILDRQRKLILEKNQINSQVNKYLDQLPISKEKGEQETNAIFAKLEKITGVSLSDDEKKEALAGKLDQLAETFKELDLKGTTVFFWDKEKDLPKIGDHMIYGYMKAASEAICQTRTVKRGTILQSAAFTTSIISKHVRCEEDFITFDQNIKTDEEGQPAYLQRSLRAKTAQGPRISLAKSEQVPAGAKLKFKLKVMDGSPLEEKHLKEIFDYGKHFVGIGQWRNKGYGMFDTVIKKVPKKRAKKATKAKPKADAEALDSLF